MPQRKQLLVLLHCCSRTTNEIAYALTCDANSDCGTGGTALTSADLVNIIPFEMSSAAVGYGNLGGVCHFMTAVGGPNTCLPAAGGGTASSILVYSPQQMQLQLLDQMEHCFHQLLSEELVQRFKQVVFVNYSKP